MMLLGGAVHWLVRLAWQSAMHEMNIFVVLLW
jgi:hypothetical protein